MRGSNLRNYSQICLSIDENTGKHGESEKLSPRLRARARDNIEVLHTGRRQLLARRGSSGGRHATTMIVPLRQIDESHEVVPGDVVAVAVQRISRQVVNLGCCEGQRHVLLS